MNYCIDSYQFIALINSIMNQVGESRHNSNSYVIKFNTKRCRILLNHINYITYISRKSYPKSFFFCSYHLNESLISFWAVGKIITLYITNLLRSHPSLCQSPLPDLDFCRTLPNELLLFLFVRRVPTLHPA